MITDNEWSRIKEEMKKTFERILASQVGTLEIKFEELVDVFRSVLERELGDNELDDRQEVIKAIRIRYKDKAVNDYGTAAAMLALKLEAFFKRVYKIINETLWSGEKNMLKGQIVTFVSNFKFVYVDPLFSSADLTVFDNPNKEFLKTDANNVPLFPPEYFKTKFPFGEQFKIAYDLRNREGHLDPDTDDDQNSLLIKEILTVYLFVTYKYSKRLKQVVCHKPILDNISNWSIFSTLCNSFNRRQAYFLIVDRMVVPNGSISNLANLKWDFVFDLDPQSDFDGILHFVKPVSNQAINQIIHRYDDRGALPSFPNNTTFWYFLKGNNQVLKSLPSKDTYAEWRSMYVRYTSDLMIKYYQENFGSKSTVINVIVLSKESFYVKDIVYAIKDMGGRLNINFIFANDDNSSCIDLITEINAKAVEVPVTQLLQGFNQLGSQSSILSTRLRVPCISHKGRIVDIPVQVSQALNQYFKIVHWDILNELTENISDKTFYQGRTIEWKELDNNYDITREISKSIHDTLRNWLQLRSDSGLFTLVHHPGSGGTTIARRIAFLIHHEYPVLLLNETTINFDENKIADRLHQLFTITELPALIIIDNSNVSKAQIEQLKRTIEHRLVKVIIFTIESGFNVPQKEDNTFYLKGSLEKAEVSRFLDRFSKEFKTQEVAFKQIIAENNPAILTPFYFGLIAYQEEFITIERYVKIRLAGITEKEKNLLILLAFFHFYAKGKSRDVPHFVISSFLGVEEDFIRLHNHISNPKILDLIIETEPDQYVYWRTIHPIISHQILRETFEPNSVGELNPSKLKSFAISIIRCLREISNQTSYEVLQLLYSLFVQRSDGYAIDDTDESTATNGSKFSSLVSDLQTNQSRIEVFEVLTTEFPKDHPHFWGHFSRLYSIDKDLSNALRTINIAIDLDSSDYRMFHIKGMCYRTELYSLKDKYFGKKDEVTEEIMNEIQKYYENAEVEFRRTCELAPYKEHGYVSFVQMSIQVIEFGFSISFLRNERREFTLFITNPANKWYQSILAATKEFIDLYNSKNIETVSQKLEQYKINLLKFWGEKEKMINAWHGLLGSNHHDQNVIRRNLAYAYLAKGDFDWKSIKGKDLLKIQELALENLEGTFDTRDLNLWFEVSRRLNTNISILIGRLEELEFKIETLQSAYYLMSLYAVKVLAGGAGSALDSYEKYIQKIRERKDGPYNKIFCPEWLGSKDESIVLVNSRDIGGWNKERQFFEDGNLQLLRRIKGKVVKYNRPQEGFIEISGSGILAVYQPGKFGHYNSDAEKGTSVEFYVGFNYDGARAFSVIDV